MPRQRSKKQGTIAQFWENYPTCYNIKQVLAIVVEFCFLAGSIRALHLDADHSCEDEDQDEIVILFKMVRIEKIRYCLSILIALHILNSVRLVYKMCVRTNDNFKGKQGICKCLIVDSYCCLGALAYAYT